MKQYIYELFENTGNLTVRDMAFHILVAMLIGFFIYLSYWISHSGTIYSKKFNVSLVILTVLTATVMTVIGNNIALSLGMIGALSIVRFRTAIKDSRDTVYIFWTIVVGICCGVGDYLVAAIGSSAVFVVLIALGRIRNDERLLLIIRASRQLESKVEAIVYNCYNGHAVLKVKNTNMQAVEFIFELSKRTNEKAVEKGNIITDSLYNLGGVEYVNLVSQNDDIGS